MEKIKKIKIDKNILGFFILVLLIGATLWIILKDNDIGAIWNAVINLKPQWLTLAIAAAIFFVCAEGLMIWYLLRALKCKMSPLRCIGYSFVGFFFSGITPSATGGQPMQLYYMNKDKIKIADATVTLTVVATLYKFILVVIGLFVGICFNNILKQYLEGYIYLFYFGLVLNSIVVAVLLFLMINPNAFRKILRKCERALVRIHILKPSLSRLRKLNNIAGEYNDAIRHFIKNRKPVIVTTIMTIIQRTSIFFITYFIYSGIGLNKENVITITVLQASVYVAVDLLPLPGSQGISELMYQTVFSTIFLGANLPASVLITRGISFYIPLILGAIITGIFYFITNKDKTKKENI